VFSRAEKALNGSKRGLPAVANIPSVACNHYTPSSPPADVLAYSSSDSTARCRRHWLRPATTVSACATTHHPQATCPSATSDPATGQRRLVDRRQCHSPSSSQEGASCFTCASIFPSSGVGRDMALKRTSVVAEKSRRPARVTCPVLLM
jgi:hypothetical protein